MDMEHAPRGELELTFSARCGGERKQNDSHEQRYVGGRRSTGSRYKYSIIDRRDAHSGELLVNTSPPSRIPVSADPRRACGMISYLQSSLKLMPTDDAYSRMETTP